MTRPLALLAALATLMLAVPAGVSSAWELAETGPLVAGPVFAGGGVAWAERDGSCIPGGSGPCIERVVLLDAHGRRVLREFEVTVAAAEDGIGADLELYNLAGSRSRVAYERSAALLAERTYEPVVQEFGTITLDGAHRRLQRCHVDDRRCGERLSPLEAGGIALSGNRIAVGVGPHQEDGITVFDLSGPRGRRRFVPAPRDVLFCCDLFDIAGRFVAIMGHGEEIAVIDWRDTRRNYRVRLRKSALAGILGASVQPDGTVAFAYAVGRRIEVGWASRREPRPHLFGGHLSGRPRIARGLVAVAGARRGRQPTRFLVFDLRGRLRRTLTAGSALGSDALVDFDGNCLLWTEPSAPPFDEPARLRLMVAEARRGARCPRQPG